MDSKDVLSLYLREVGRTAKAIRETEHLLERKTVEHIRLGALAKIREKSNIIQEIAEYR